MLLQTNPQSEAQEGRTPLPERAAAGDLAALAAFYEAHVDQVYSFVYARVGGDRALAEDVVQETFARAICDIHRYDATRGTLSAWLRTLSRNAARDLLRAHHRGAQLRRRWEQQHKALAEVATALEREPLGDAVLARAEVRSAVQLVIADLTPKYRRILNWKYRDGESLTTIAERIGLGVPATKSLLARARRAFRETFASLSQELGEVP